jgi:hypothetical protein
MSIGRDRDKHHFHTVEGLFDIGGHHRRFGKPGSTEPCEFYASSIDDGLEAVLETRQIKEVNFVAR